MNISVYFDVGKNPNPGSLIGKVLTGLDGSNSGGFAVVEGVQFERDANGVHIEVNSFIAGPPQIVAGLQVREVRIFDQAQSQRPRLGIYKRWGAEAVVDIYDPDNQKVPEWRVRVVGPDWRSAVKLYKAIRFGRVRPVQDWQAGYVTWRERFWSIWKLVQRALATTP